MHVTSVQSISYRGEWRGGGQATPEPRELWRGPGNAGYCPLQAGRIHSAPWPGKFWSLQTQRNNRQLTYTTPPPRKSEGGSMYAFNPLEPSGYYMYHQP
jgi:hypothetical protein